MKQCPNCSEWNKPDAILCTHCGHQFEPVAASGFRRTPNLYKFGCAILILLAFALALWAFASRYQKASPEAANAVQAPPAR